MSGIRGPLRRFLVGSKWLASPSVAVRSVASWAGWWATERHDLEAAWLILVAFLCAAGAFDWTAGARLGAVRIVTSARDRALVFAACVVIALLLYWRSLAIGLLSDD